MSNRNRIDSDSQSQTTSPNSVIRLLIFSTLVCCLGLGIPPVPAQGSPPAGSGVAEDDTATIKKILEAQTNAWNEGDLEKFMMTYWKSDKLTFCSGGKTTYGWQATLDNYRKSYSSPESMGRLNFDGLEISMIESNSALVLGRWHLTMADDSKRDGNFSLVVKKLGDHWKIIHDHSSSLEPK